MRSTWTLRIRNKLSAVSFQWGRPVAPLFGIQEMLRDGECETPSRLPAGRRRYF